MCRWLRGTSRLRWLVGVAQFAATIATALAGDIGTKVQPLSVLQCLMESGEVEELATIFIGAEVAASAYQSGLVDIA